MPDPPSRNETSHATWALVAAAVGATFLVGRAACSRTATDGRDVAIAPGEISVASLVDEMGDLDALAREPDAPWTIGQSDSHDRRSIARGDETWFANDDFVTEESANLVRIDRAADGSKRYVLLDAEGPGAVVRLWSATPAGTLRVEIDGALALEAPMNDLLAGRIAPYGPPFGHEVARGYNLFFPFPYAKRCVITTDSITSNDPFTGRPTAKLYFQVGYRTYPSGGGAVRPFSASEVARAEPILARTARRLEHPDDGPVPATRRVVRLDPAPIDRATPRTLTIDAPSGGAMIRAIHLRMRTRDDRSLRATTLAIAFDGKETVRAPLGDFFGSGPGLAAFESLPFSVSADGSFTSRFRMPFRERATITLGRSDDGTTDVDGEISVDPAPFDGKSLLFHASFHAPERVATRPRRDLAFATTTGRGRLVGTTLEVENPPGVAWWGEGDEKIWVDGATAPTIFGTGTEDYFGYAWSTTDRFAHPLHAQTRVDGPGFAGWFSMNRFHVLDAIPFEKGLHFDWEIWHWSETSIAIGGMAYWYERPRTEALGNDPKSLRD